MYNQIYSKKEQDLFTNRTKEINQLSFYLEQLLKNHPQKIAVLGVRRIGKTILLLEFIKRNIRRKKIKFVYLNLQRLVIEPRSFAKSYIGAVLKWALNDQENALEQYEDLKFLLLKASSLRHQKIQNFLLDFSNLYEKTDAPNKIFLETAFSFPKIISQALNLHLIIILDEFQEVLDFNNFQDLPNILGFWRDLIKTHNQVWYILAGSYVRMMERISQDAGSPLFGQIKNYYIGPLDKVSSLKFLKKKFALANFKTTDQEILFKLYNLTKGHPYYLDILTDALIEQKAVYKTEITLKAVEQIFALSIVDVKSPLCAHLKYIYQDSLSRARGAGVLKAILKILTRFDKLTIAELSKKTGKKPGLINLSLKELTAIDLVSRQGNYYFIQDRVLKIWLYFNYWNIEGSFSLQDKIVGDILEEIKEKFQEVSTELGIAKEAEIREFLRKMQGKIFRAELFGLKKGNLKIPKFKTIEPSQDKKREIDILASNTHTWAVEIKWRNQVIDKQELQKFKSKIKANKYWFIAKAGLTKDAAKYAQRAGIMVSDQNDLAEINRSAQKQNH